MSRPRVQEIWCPACSRCIAINGLRQHLTGKQHLQLVKRAENGPAVCRMEWECFKKKHKEYFIKRVDLEGNGASGSSRSSENIPTSGPGHCPICRQDGIQYVNLEKHLYSEVHARKLAIATRTVEWAPPHTIRDWAAFLKKYSHLTYSDSSHDEAVRLAVACANYSVRNVKRIMAAARDVGFEFGEPRARPRVSPSATPAPALTGATLGENLTPYWRFQQAISDVSCEEYPSSEAEYSDSQDSVKEYYYSMMKPYMLDPGDEDYMGGGWRNSEEGSEEDSEEESELEDEEEVSYADDEDEYDSEEEEDDYFSEEEQKDGKKGDESDWGYDDDDEDCEIVKWETAKKEPFALEKRMSLLQRRISVKVK